MSPFGGADVPSALELIITSVRADSTRFDHNGRGTERERETEGFRPQWSPECLVPICRSPSIRRSRWARQMMNVMMMMNVMNVMKVMNVMTIPFYSVW